MRFLLIIPMFLFAACAYALDIQSDAFRNSGHFASAYTCDGVDVSPSLSWSGAPADTKSFVLIYDDPDSFGKPWSHWVVFNIPKDKTSFAQGLQKTATFDDGTVQGVNDFGKTGYNGPCGPPGKLHRYFFRLYALDTLLLLDEHATREAVLKAIKGHILAEAEIYATYDRM